MVTQRGALSELGHCRPSSPSHLDFRISRTKLELSAVHTAPTLFDCAAAGPASRLSNTWRLSRPIHSIGYPILGTSQSQVQMERSI
eukprot:gene1550-1686_t